LVTKGPVRPITESHRLSNGTATRRAAFVWHYGPTAQSLAVIKHLGTQPAEPSVVCRTRTFSPSHPSKSEDRQKYLGGTTWSSPSRNLEDPRNNISVNSADVLHAGSTIRPMAATTGFPYMAESSLVVVSWNTSHRCVRWLFSRPTRRQKSRRAAEIAVMRNYGTTKVASRGSLR
jgi:hypothetical protein